MSKAQIEAELQEYIAAGWRLVTRTEYGSTLLRMVHEQDRIATSEACRPANLLRLLRGTLYKNNANFVAWQAQTGQQPAPSAADTPAPVAPEPPSPAAKQVNSQNMAILGEHIPEISPYSGNMALPPGAHVETHAGIEFVFQPLPTAAPAQYANWKDRNSPTAGRD